MVCLNVLKCYSAIMCGRFTLTTTNEELMHRFGIRLEQNLQPRYNIAPTHKTLILRPNIHNQVSSYKAILAQFGLPSAAGSNMLINARSETVTEKPTFADAFKQSRCLILSDGWYEWDAKRTPYHIHLKDKRSMVMAGLLFKRGSGLHFTIMTAAAQGKMAEMHHRTPVILPKAYWWKWLVDQPSDAENYLAPPSDKFFAWHEVDKAVGKVANDGPELMAPVASAGVLFG